MKKFQRGNFVEWLLIAVAVSVVIFAFLIVFGLKSRLLDFSFRAATTTNALVSGADKPSYGATTTGKTITSKKTTPTFGSSSAGGSGVVTSPPAESIIIQTGNASYAVQPIDEYIILRNISKYSIDISGWRLFNAKASHNYPSGNVEVTYTNDAALIPQGTKLVPTNDTIGIQEDIVLKPGEAAIVVTGAPGNQASYKLTSFKENECTGYLGEIYRFPTVSGNRCVDPNEEPGVNNLELACRDYLEGMQSCHKPTIVEDRTQGPLVDGTPRLSGACIGFIRTHYSYSSCIANHVADTSFEGSIWHVYLSKPWELWASRYETISLYDRTGRLITKTSY